MRKLSYLYLSGFLFWSATNLITPFISFFAINEISGVTIENFGVSNLIYFLSFGISVIIVGKSADLIKGIKDDFVIAIIGYLLRGLLFILLAFSNTLLSLYFFQLFLGISRGFSDSVKEKIQIRLTQRDFISTSFSVNSGIVNIAAAIGAGGGGLLAGMIGFRYVSVIVGILTLIAGIVYGLSYREIRKDF